MENILVLYYSRHDSTRALAETAAQGAESIDDTQVRTRTVPAVSTVCEATQPDVPDSGSSYMGINDLEECVGLALGSLMRFGNVTAPLKCFLDGTTPRWLVGVLAGKPICVFTSTGNTHGGQEATLLSMILPLLHYGMVALDLPYQHSELLFTEAGGTPCGPSYVAHCGDTTPPTVHERTLATIMDRQLAQIVLKLAA